MSTFAILPARASGQSELEGCGYLDTGGEREVLSDQSAAILVGLFHVRIVDPILVRDQRILIVDDIVTTGSTLSECARVLKAAGAKKVFAATLSRSRVE